MSSADEDEHNAVFSSSSEEDDPRVSAMFSNALLANHDDDHEENNTFRRQRQVHVAENSILDCFRRALDSYGNANPGAVDGIWKAPPLFPVATDGGDDARGDSSMNKQEESSHWNPASLPLPAWVVRPPAESTSSLNSVPNTY